MKLAFCQENIGNTFPVLWEGYSEALEGEKQRVFGYTPNYLKTSCIISNDESVENKTINTKLTASGEAYMLGDILGKTA
jgi:threonylcarbamoyladenosine tRNA methylthiotransferase MtaB